MRICLIYPIINAPSISYSYGLGYVSSMLKKDRHQVDYIIVWREKDIPRLVNYIRQKSPQIIGFSSTSWQFPYVRTLSEDLKKDSDAFICAGGVHPTLEPSCIKQATHLDAIIRGEGEHAACELVRAMENGEEIKGIQNLWLKDRSTGEICSNGLRPLISDLDGIPFADKQSLDYQDILNRMAGMNRFIFSRGCVHDCPYCSNKALRELYPGQGSYYRHMSPERACAEIEHDAMSFQFKEIFFDDDCIAADKKWFYSFFSLYSKKFSYPFYCNARVGSLDKDMLNLLKGAGARGIAFGLEHGNEVFRKEALRKDISNDAIEKSIKLTSRAGITENIGQVMIGLPGETPELYLDTVRLCRRLGLSYYPYIFHPYPGTEFGQLCKSEGKTPKKDIYVERHEALYDYKRFSSKNIKVCYDMFGFLVAHPGIPLCLPGIRPMVLLKIYNWARKILRAIKKISLQRAAASHDPGSGESSVPGETGTHP